MARKPGGRRKLPMERIEKRSSRDVTFSKRRSGVFKKADELTTICGAEVGLIVFSPAGKAYSFGSPDVDTIVDRLTMDGGGGGGGGGAPSHGVRELNDQLTRIEELLAAERKRAEELANTSRAVEEENRRSWWRPEYEGQLGMSELGRLKESMEELKRRVVVEAHEQKELAKIAAAMNTLSANGNFADGGPYAAVSSPANHLNFHGAGPSSVNPYLGGADPYAAMPSFATPQNFSGVDPYAAMPSFATPQNFSGADPYAVMPTSAIPQNFSGAGLSSVNAYLGGTDPYAAGPSSAAPPNMHGGGSGFGYGPQGPF